MNEYYYVIGRDRTGGTTTCGPYPDEETAEEATSHLVRTQIHRLNTRDLVKARRILKSMRQGGGSGVASGMHADEPVGNPPPTFGQRLQRFRDMIQRPKDNSDDEDGY